MTTTDLTQELELRAGSPQAKTVYDLLQRQRPEIEKALPAHLDGERFLRIVFTEIRRTPKLLDCSPESLLGAMMLAAQLGLEPGPLGHVYLVPFKGQVEFIVGYKGMIDLAFRSDKLKDVAAKIVYAGDAFDFREGTRPYLDHKSDGPPGDREPTHFYAVARLRTGGAPFVVLYPEDIAAAQKRSPAGAKGVGPWVTDWAAMARKTCVRRLSAFLPQSPQLAQALERDEAPVPFLDGGDLAGLAETAAGVEGDAA
jgi:recombination protein RecT